MNHSGGSLGYIVATVDSHELLKVQYSARRNTINTDVDRSLLAVKVASRQHSPTFLPVECVGYFAPELFRIVDALCVHLPVLIDGPDTHSKSKILSLRVTVLRGTDPTCAEAETLAGGACNSSAIEEHKIKWILISFLEHASHL